MRLSDEVKALEQEVVDLRRDFHEHPELGWEEHRTAEVVSDYLSRLGLEVQRVTTTGVVGLLRGKEDGPTLMLRADIDALPIQEETGLPYSSKNEGKMHACGHDGHTAMLLVAAKILAGYRERLKGNIKLVFQPNEESVGAKAMIDEGVLESPSVDCCLGQHLWCPLPIGELGLSSGPVMAGMDHFTLRVKGKGGHTAAPHMAVDPILCASEIIQSIQAVQTRETDPLTPVVIMFGQINGGTASNVIPDQVEVSGTLRHLCPESEEHQSSPQGRMERLISHICQAHRAGYELDFLYGHPALVNDAGTVDLVREATRSCGLDQGAVQPLVTLAGEDFSEFAARVPSAFYFVGAGNEAKNICYPHHHPCFNIDEDALSIGVELHVRSALEYFRLNG